MSDSLLIEIIKYIKENYFLFSSIYLFIFILQLGFLYKSPEKAKLNLFIVNKIFVFIFVGCLWIYFQNILGFYLYIIGVVLLAFIFTKIKKRKIYMSEFFLIGDINLMIAFSLIFYMINLETI